jgi:uncharacterized RDD family membrane protein YckC
MQQGSLPACCRVYGLLAHATSGAVVLEAGYFQAWQLIPLLLLPLLLCLLLLPLLLCLLLLLLPLLLLLLCLLLLPLPLPLLLCLLLLLLWWWRLCTLTTATGASPCRADSRIIRGQERHVHV